jgi:glucose/arabinose dehydrogenase
VLPKLRLSSAVLAASCVTAGALALPPDFIDRPLDADFDQAVGLRFAPDGRIFVWEKGGKVWTVEDGVKSAQALIDLSEEVGNWRDHGLLGFALDPNFYANGYIYLLYVVDYHHARYFGTPQYDPHADVYFHDTIGRLTRYTANVSDGFHSVDPASRLVLIGDTLTNGIPVCHQSHSMGTIRFGTDGTLLVSCGDGASYETVDVGGPQSGSSNTCLPDGIITPAQDVGAYRAQIINCYNGKVLRMDPASGAGLASNPFYDPADPYSARSRVWAMGLRNPFRTTLRPGTGAPDPAAGNPGSLYIGDVGWNSWEEINVARAGGYNFGWPAYEGMAIMSDYFSASPNNQDAPNPLAGGSCPAYFRFRNLIVQETLNTPSWPNPCNPAQQIPAALRHMHRRPQIDWFHGSGPSRTSTFNASGFATITNIGAPGSPVPGPQFGGFCSIGGAWVPTSGTSWPPEWRGAYITGDYAAQWIRAFNFNDQDRPTLCRDFEIGAGAVVNFEFDPVSDRLWYVNYDDAGVSRVRSIRHAVNAPPIAAGSATPSYGPAPLAVAFSSAGTVDPDQSKQPPSVRWDFGDGTFSLVANPVHSYPEEDITAQGQWVAAVLSLNPPHPTGGGNWDPNVMRDGVYPPVGSGDSATQYDTFHNGQQGNLDYIGLDFLTRRTFTRIMFQEGIHFADGGWFDNLAVEVLDTTGGYVPVQNLVVTPAYAGNDGVNFNTYELTFTPVAGRRIRIVGNPGGSANFVSVGEFRVFAKAASVPSTPRRYDAVLTVTDEFNATDTATVPVWINNTPPTVQITSPVDGASYPLSDETVIDLTADTGDAEQPGGLTCAWQTILHHNDHTHPEPIDPNCRTTTQLSPHGCDGATYYFEIRLTVSDPLGLSTTRSVSVFSADCNANGVPDNCDIDAGTSLDIDHNGVPDECQKQPVCVADFNHDAIVNSTDVSDFINQWFQDFVDGTSITDFDRNGIVNSTDVSEFINAYFESPVECLG